MVSIRCYQLLSIIFSSGPASSNRSREFQRAFPPTKKSKASQLDETDSRLEDFLLKMEKKKENVRREFDNRASSEAKTASKGKGQSCRVSMVL